MDKQKAKFEEAQLPGGLFSPWDKYKQLTQQVLLHFLFGMRGLNSSKNIIF